MRKIVILFVFVMGITGSAFAANNALWFDAMDDYVVVPDSNSLDVTTGITIEAWIKSENQNFTGRTIVSKFSSFPPLYGYSLKSRHMFDKMQWAVSDNQGTALGYYMIDMDSASSVPLGDWTHVVGTYDSTSQEGRIYLNSNLDAVQPIRPLTNGIINIIPNDVYIGATNMVDGGIQTYQQFGGTIDELRIWNYARTQQQLQEWMYCPLNGNEPGLVGYWNFDEGTGSMLHDASLYGNNGNILGAQWVASDSPVHVIPEPASMLLLGIGGLAMAVLKRKKNNHFIY